jgi:hypothetical protein
MDSGEKALSFALGEIVTYSSGTLHYNMSYIRKIIRRNQGLLGRGRICSSWWKSYPAAHSIFGY